MKKYGIALIILTSLLANTTYAYSQSEQEDSTATEPVTYEESDDKDDSSSENKEISDDEKKNSVTQDDEIGRNSQKDSSPREKYNGVGKNINYSDPSSNNYVAPPIFPFPDAYMLRLPQEVTVEDVQIHPPILPYPHRMQYEVEQNLSGNSNR